MQNLVSELPRILLLGSRVNRHPRHDCGLPSLPTEMPRGLIDRFTARLLGNGAAGIIVCNKQYVRDALKLMRSSTKANPL